MKLRKKIAIIFNSIYWNLKKNIVKGHLNISFLQLLSKDTHIKITEKARVERGQSLPWRYRYQFGTNGVALKS